MQGGPGRVLGRLGWEGWKGRDLRCGGRGSARLVAGGTTALAQSGRSRSDPGEIPPAWSRPAAGARPGHCSPRRRSALASCRERAVPAAPPIAPEPPHPQLTQCPALSSYQGGPSSLGSLQWECLLHGGCMVIPGQTSAPAGPSGATAGRCTFPARLEGLGRGKTAAALLEPFSLGNA